VLSTRSELQRLYDSTLPEGEKRRGKADIFGQMRAEYEPLKARWGGDSRYDRWFAGELNNARLAAVVTYHDLVPGFQALLAERGGDLGAFYEAVQQLGELEPEVRREELAQLARNTKAAAADPPQGSLFFRGAGQPMNPSSSRGGQGSRSRRYRLARSG